MALPAFTINLGNGIHIDSSGRLTMDVPGNIPEFSLSQPVAVPHTAIQQVFGSVGSVVPRLDFFPEDLDVFKALGLSAEFSKVLASVGTIATTLASIIPYVNMAMALLSILGAAGGSDPVGEEILAEIKNISHRIDEIENNNARNFASDCVSKFSSAMPELSNYQQALSKSKRFRRPNELEDQRKKLQDKLSDVRDTLFQLLDRNWHRPFNPGDFFNSWGVDNRDLHTFPKSGPPEVARMPGHGLAFDHVLMVPIVIYGIQTYLTLVKALVPEYRTSDKSVRESLRLMADKLAPKLDEMRNKTLALTILKAGEPYFHVTPRQFYGLWIGAKDLRADTDFGEDPNMHFLQLPSGMDTRGTKVEVDGEDWWTVNPAAVELANRQAERDYAALLVRSGFLSLAHLECLMRHLSSEPDRSETVTGKAETFRKPLEAATVRVRTTDIPFSTPIEADASREPQDCKAYLTLTTQVVPSDITIRYRVRLMTLPDGDTQTPFSSYVWNTYLPDGGSRNFKLHVNENSPLALDPVGPNERLLADSISPGQPIQEEGTITLTADTFDWYVPVPDNPIRIEHVRDSIRVFGVTTGAKPIPMPPSGPGGAPGLSKWNITAVSSEITGVGLGWDEGGQTWKGERREWRRTPIQLNYKLYWHEDQLSVSLKARPEDRNFVVYLVVEEFLLDSQQWLRTPVQVLFNGQLTYVPESFFEAENKARKRAIELLKEIEQKYRKSRKPGPTDPVVGGVRRGTFTSVSAMQDFVNRARRHAPEVVEEALGQLSRAAATD